MSITFLEKIISSEDVVDDSHPVLDPGKIEDSTNLITTAAQKIILLENIYNNHQLLTVELEHDDAQYSSLILEINEEETYLVLDEFYPRPAPGAISVNTKIKFYTFLSGIQMDFTSTIEAISENENRPYYKIPLPDKVLYYQNRQYLRVPVSIVNPIRIVLSDNKSSSTNGEIRDLSAGGFSARLKLIEQRYSVSDLIPNCILYMPGDKKIYCSVEIRQSERATLAKPPKIGARFLDIRSNDQKVIEKFVAEVDRELTRRFRR